MKASVTSGRTPGLLALLCLCLGSLLAEAAWAESEGRIIILGFDGMDPKLAQQWMDDGSLPNFRELAARGSFAPLGTSNPPQSPVAWSDFATGLHPGGHGIYDFLRRDPATYQPVFSISETHPPQQILELFGLQLPLDSPQILNRRQGQPFWMDHEAAGGKATVQRVPATFPPDPVHRMLSGMGVPDLLGTQGTYTFFSTRATDVSSTASARTVRLRPSADGRIEASLEGPAHPLKPDAPVLSTPLTITPAGERARIELGDTSVELAAGEWSDWVTVEFDFLGPLSASGIVRLYLVQSYPRVQLYVSPIHIDPRAPVVPLSSPAGYAEDLVEAQGLYHTIGMPEETWSLNEGHLPDSAWLDVVRTTLAESEQMFYAELESRDSDLVIGVFVQTDRVSHMFYRGIDPQHPLHAGSDATVRGAIRWIYTEADRVLGETLQRLQPEDRLLVLSDHGFAPFRRSVHLNRWLVDAGYLVLKEGSAGDAGVGFSQIDWSASRAYALGLNSIFINMAGRERWGLVEPWKVPALKKEIRQKLAAVTDPATGERIVQRVFDGAELYPGNAHGDAPELVVGYAPGYRASWQTTLGGVPATLVEDNASKWSGDHCVDPATVPGVLFTSFKPEQPIPNLQSVASWVRAQ